MAHRQAVFRRVGSWTTFWLRTASNTVRDMMRMLKSTAWTVSWPMNALTLHVNPGDADTAFARFTIRSIPDMELLSELMQS